MGLLMYGLALPDKHFPAVVPTAGCAMPLFVGDHSQLCTVHNMCRDCRLRVGPPCVRLVDSCTEFRHGHLCQHMNGGTIHLPMGVFLVLRGNIMAIQYRRRIYCSCVGRIGNENLL